MNALAKTDQLIFADSRVRVAETLCTEIGPDLTLRPLANGNLRLLLAGHFERHVELNDIQARWVMNTIRRYLERKGDTE